MIMIHTLNHYQMQKNGKIILKGMFFYLDFVWYNAKMLLKKMKGL